VRITSILSLRLPAGFGAGRTVLATFGWLQDAMVAVEKLLVAGFVNVEQ
jgi:hypothetical protein